MCNIVLYIRGDARCATLPQLVLLPEPVCSISASHSWTKKPHSTATVFLTASTIVSLLGVCINQSYKSAHPSMIISVLTREKHEDSFISISSHLICIWKYLIPQVVQLSSFILSCEITTQPHEWLETNKDLISLPFAWPEFHIWSTVKSKHCSGVLTCTAIEIQLAIKS